MSQGQPEIHAEGVTQAVTDLNALGERASDVRRVSEKVRSVYRRSEEQMFSTRGRGTWPRLAEATLRIKSQQGYPPDILVRTGALRRALTAARASNQIDLRNPTEFHFGTTLPYAQFVNRRRTLIDLHVGDRQEITDLIRRYVTRAQS